METNVNSLSEYRAQQRFSVSDSCNRADPTSSIASNQWQNPGRETRRDNGKNGDRNRNKSLHAKNRENYDNEDDMNRHMEEQQPPLQAQQITSGFPAYTYNASEHYVDQNQRAIPMMSSFGYMNPQWGLGPLEGISVSQNNLSVAPSAATSMSLVPGMDMLQNSGTHITPYGYVPENNMFAMMGGGSYSPYGVVNGQENLGMPCIKPLITLSKCTLIPTGNTSTKRPKPLLCKTVYVSNYPDKVTKDIIEEIFSRYGTILSIQMNERSSHNFCHIRFDREEEVEAALCLDGYKIKLNDEICSRPIVVNYAHNRADEHEYNCKLRAIERAARHREREKLELHRPPTPPPVAHYSDHECNAVQEKLKKEETFQQGLHILITWLDRGECHKNNSGHFFSAIQSVYSHIKRLTSEKVKYQDELNKAKNTLKQQMLETFLLFHEIENIFLAASVPKVWDNFSKTQRRSIGSWKTQTLQYKNSHIQEMIQDHEEDEMELSNDNSPEKSQDQFYNEVDESIKEEINDLREKNNQICCQIKAADNEITVLISENAKYESIIQKLEMEKKLREEGGKKFKQSVPVGSSSGPFEITETEAHLVGLISTFLNVHPFGASIDYICSYVHQIDTTFKARDVENLLKRFPSIFKEESSGIGATLERKWFYFGFKSSF